MAYSAEHVCHCFLILLGMISSLSSSRVLKSQEIEHQTSNSSEAEPSPKLKFSGGIGIGISIGKGSGNGTGNAGTIGFAQGSGIGIRQGSGGGGGSGFGQGSGSGAGGGIGIGIVIGGGIEWKSRVRAPKRDVSSSGSCCPYKEVVGEECPSECAHSASGRCCPLEVTRKVEHERAMGGQKRAVPLSHQDDHAWAPSN